MNRYGSLLALFAGAAFLAGAALLAGCCASPEPTVEKKKVPIYEMDEVATYGETLKFSVLDSMTFMGRKATPAELRRIEDARERALAEPDVIVAIPTVQEVPDPKKGNVYLGVKIKIENVHPTDKPRGGARNFIITAEDQVEVERPKTYAAENRAVFFDKKDQPLKTLRTYKLRTGQAATGWIVFQVPEDGTDWVLRFGRGPGVLQVRIEID